MLKLDVPRRKEFIRKRWKPKTGHWEKTTKKKKKKKKKAEARDRPLEKAEARGRPLEKAEARDRLPKKKKKKKKKPPRNSYHETEWDNACRER